MFKIATLYSSSYTTKPEPITMDTVRWIRISEAFARLGCQVDVIVNDLKEDIQESENLRYISHKRARWEDYDVIKTLFHKGMDFLKANNADDHPFIISKLGSVVGRHNDVDGVYFFDERRKELFETQERIAQKSRYITILTEESKELFIQEHGRKNDILIIPTGTARNIPAPGKNPYQGIGDKIAVYIGNLYSEGARQREVNLMWQSKLNRLGTLLKKKGIHLCFIGMGQVDQLDPRAVIYLGEVSNNHIFDYQYFADVGIALAQGEVQHNESSKIYDYLRVGLPTVSERPIPNNWLIDETQLGYIVNYNNEALMAEKIEEALKKSWDKEEAIRYMLNHHTWEHRAQKYYRLIQEETLCLI